MGLLFNGCFSMGSDSIDSHSESIESDPIEKQPLKSNPIERARSLLQSADHPIAHIPEVVQLYVFQCPRTVSQRACEL